ncbi:hypothetical protein VNI00_002777 [Paramarasmius palmivorus]|uniref:Uncharacterized protein n=1 Tax=Paramarasmius palmivorus TaxID=297713 RepID=A0AAW0E0K6_9AGAR
MPLDTVTEDTIVQLSKAILCEYNCEFQNYVDFAECPAELASFEAYQKDHFPTSEKLVDHVENTHLSNVPLPCPFHECQKRKFTLSALKSHFHHRHSSWQGKSVEELKPHLFPSWIPTHISVPPPEPLHIFPGYVFIPSAQTSLPHISLPLQPRSPTPPISQIPETRTPRHRSLLKVQDNTSLGSITSKSSDKPDELELELEDLPQVGPDEAHQWVIWKRSSELQQELSGPMPLTRKFDAPFTPPVSIHYDVFRQKVQEMVKSGIIEVKGRAIKYWSPVDSIN